MNRLHIRPNHLRLAVSLGFFMVVACFGVRHAHAVDVTPPTIVSNIAYPADTNATILWTTDELSNSKVVYGPTGSYGSSTATLDTSPLVAYHVLMLGGLTSCSTYHYAIVTGDASGNVTTSSDSTFTTLGCASTSTGAVFQWTSHPSNGTSSWYKIAASQDGQKMVVGSILAGTGLKASTDGGTTWQTLSGAGGSQVWAADMSANGQYIAIGTVGNEVKISNDYGNTWTTPTSTGNGVWRDLAVSADGSHMVALDILGYIYLSNNYGVSWSPVLSEGTSGLWNAVAASQDHQTIVVAQYYGGLRISKNGGASWSGATGLPTQLWTDVVVSPSGSLIAAVGPGSVVWTSYNGGDTWSSQSGSGARNWNAVSIAGESNRLAAADQSGYVYISDDAGVTWSPEYDLGKASWVDMELSADGHRIVAVAPGIAVATGFEPDILAPIISGMDTSVANTSATLSWATNELASTQVSYGLTAAYGATSTEIDTSPRVRTHTQTLSGLTACTTYHWQARSQDAQGNVATSSDATFLTSGCVSVSGGGSSGGGGGSRNATVSVTTSNDPLVVLILRFKDVLTDAYNRGLTLPSIVIQTLNLQRTGTGGTGLPTSDLFLGETGSGVRALQEYLVNAATGDAAKQLKAHGLTNYFGSLTQAALIEWQTAHNVVPALGWYGPKTRAAMGL